MQQLNRTLVSNSEQLPVKILQFGEGNFLRAFVDYHINQMNKEKDFNAGVSIIQPLETGLVDILNEQEGLYTLILSGIKNGKASKESNLITCVQQGINPYKEWNAYLDQATNPELKFIISNTTEAGIKIDPNDNISDLPPISFPAKLTTLLYNRFKHFNGDHAKGLIFLPCELIESNGENLKTTIIATAKKWELPEDFIDWLNEANTFCNTLVDRIVPGYPKDKADEICLKLGYNDKLLVEGEHFMLWVIEGPETVKEAFPVSENNSNIIFTNDLKPYRTRKVRILNGAHTTLVPVAYLYGLRTVRESVEDKIIGDFINKAVFEEIVPTLDLDENELFSFAYSVFERFLNPYVDHYLQSISLNSISKYKTRVLPSFLEYYKRTQNVPQKLSFSMAALICFYKGNYNNEDISLNDSVEHIEFFKSIWYKHKTKAISTKELVQEVLSMSVWETDLNELDNLKEIIAEHIQAILDEGIGIALKRVM